MNALQIALVILVAMGLGLSLYLWVVVNGSRFIPLYADRWKKLEELYRGQILLLAFVVASFGFEDDAPRLVFQSGIHHSQGPAPMGESPRQPRMP